MKATPRSIRILGSNRFHGQLFSTSILQPTLEAYLSTEYRETTLHDRNYVKALRIPRVHILPEQDSSLGRPAATLGIQHLHRSMLTWFTHAYYHYLYDRHNTTEPYDPGDDLTKRARMAPRFANPFPVPIPWDGVVTDTGTVLNISNAAAPYTHGLELPLRQRYPLSLLWAALDHSYLPMGSHVPQTYAAAPHNGLEGGRSKILDV